MPFLGDWQLCKYDTDRSLSTTLQEVIGESGKHDKKLSIMAMVALCHVHG